MGVLSKSRWFAPIRAGYNWMRRWLFSRTHAYRSWATAPGAAESSRVLILGIYLADRPNLVTHLVRRFAETRCSVTQAWVALNGESEDSRVRGVTVERIDEYVPKFVLLNRMLSRVEWGRFDYVVFTDDDIAVQQGFLDAFLQLQIRFDFALAQPARTRNSWADLKFCHQRKGMLGRRTRFVETGPLFCVRRDLAPRMLPFDETSPMGWGFDFVWPLVAESAGLTVGIIDATPVDHSIRGQAVAYSTQTAGRAMQAYLAGKKYLSKQQAFTVLETF